MKTCSIKIDNFKQKLWNSGFTDTSSKGLDNIAIYFSRSPRTIRRWIKTDTVPEWAIKKLNNDSKKLTEKWRNFHFKNDELVTPNGYRFSPKQLETLAMQADLIRAFYSR